MEHNFGFSSQNIEEYSIAIEDQLEAIGKSVDAAQKATTADLEDDFDQDFIGGSSLKDEIEGLDEKVGNLESLNLFGVEMDADSVMNKMQKRKGASKEEVGAILQDLVQLVTEIDPSGSTRDFKKRKSFVYYDPYNPDRSASFAHLRYEDEAKMRASLVVQQYADSLQDIKEEMKSNQASVANQKRYRSINEMLDRLNDIKITDPQVLSKLYNMYRYQLSEDERNL